MHEEGLRRIVGIDEAGRGAWAGPVAAGAVCLPIENADLSDILAGVRDSKMMTPRQRERLVDTIKATAVAWGVGSASNHEIDELGIVPATKTAMRRAWEHLKIQFPRFEPDCLFLDGMKWEEAPVTCAQKHIVRGDRETLTIAAASVIAKVWRDAYMRELSNQYPEYGFAQHKGYGTVSHRRALFGEGPTAIHRRSFSPMKDLLLHQDLI
ncbi:MAG: ribonuclease HII [Anaerolineae bacterium]